MTALRSELPVEALKNEQPIFILKPGIMKNSSATFCRRYFTKTRNFNSGKIFKTSLSEYNLKPNPENAGRDETLKKFRRLTPIMSFAENGTGKFLWNTCHKIQNRKKKKKKSLGSLSENF